MNVDRRRAPGVDVAADLRAGLPFPAGSFDAAVGIHVLQDLAYLDVVPVLRELHRVLRRGAVLRLGLPDLERALDAYRRNHAAYFHVPDADAASLGGKLVAQLVWYGAVRTPFTFDCVAEMLAKAGFTNVRRCAFGDTASGDPELASLDDRARESLFVEAERGP